MGTLRTLTKGRNGTVIAVVLILALAAFLRLYHIGWCFSSDGVDEGIMLERSVMVNHGYQIYSDIPCDQAPLAFYIGAALGANYLTLRSFVAVLSIVAIAASMLASSRLRGNNAMLVTGLLLAVDFALLRESRLFSLDAISASFLALSIPPFLSYLRRGGRAMVALSGLMVGLSTCSKLLGALGLLGMLIFMVVEMKSKVGDRRKLGLDIAVLLVGAAIPLAVAMAALGAGDMIQGMVFDQGHRGFDLGLKLSIAGFFAVNLAYLVPLVQAKSLWKQRPEFRFLLSVSLVVLVFMIVQPLTFFHHMVMLSFPLAILAGVSISSAFEQRKRVREGPKPSASRRGTVQTNPLIALAVVGVLVSSGLGVYGLAIQRSTIQDHFASIEVGSRPAQWVVSGDPLITAEAGLRTPPELINVAYRQYPELTEAELESQILKYNVTVVIVCYRLNDMPGLPEFLLANGYVTPRYAQYLHFTGDEPVLNLFEKGIGPVSVFYKESYLT